MSNTHPTPYQQLQAQLLMAPRTWLITGVAGFIGSHLLHTLLKLNQHVVGLDNLSTGYHHNLDEVKTLLTPLQWGRFNFIEGDIRDLPDCHRACHSADHVVHLAALDSPKLSLADADLDGAAAGDRAGCLLQDVLQRLRRGLHGQRGAQHQGCGAYAAQLHPDHLPPKARC